nr:50S ribosome-binding GTPase [Elusimicrobiaceae bacterium]
MTNKNQEIPQDITLANLPKRHEAEIVSINCPDVALRTRILDMGLTPRVKVTLIKTAPMGDPLEIKVRGYLLTLRKHEAEKILITNVKKASSAKKQEQTKTLQPITLHSQKGEEFYYQTQKQLNPKKHYHLALVGNQNSGKTTLFNRLTGAHQKVGNFPGVTVTRTDGKIKNHPEITITDLPGIYSLSPYSQDEIIARNFILENKPDAIINIVDAANIERNLFLTTQLIELNIPMVIALNMIDEVTKSGGSIDVNGLEDALGVPVVAISASKNQGVEELLEHIINVAKYQERPVRLDFCSNEEEQKGAVHRCI